MNLQRYTQGDPCSKMTAMQSGQYIEAKRLIRVIDLIDETMGSDYHAKWELLSRMAEDDDLDA